jgi:cell division protein FtsW
MFSREKKTRLAEWWWTIDRELLIALLALIVVGLVLSFAASPPVGERIANNPWHFVVRHCIFAVPAVLMMVFASQMSARWARIAGLGVLVVSVLMLWATLKIGVEIKGARRWVSLFGQSIQPSEFVKPAFAVIGAWLISEKMQHKDMPGRLLTLLIMLSIVGALLLQPDIGQTALVLVTWATLLFLSGISWFIIFGLLGGGVALLFSAYHLFPHFQRRIDAFLDPDAGHSSTYQIEKAQQALLEGGWLGRGPGESIAKRFVPDAHADYVFSAAAGEFGILFCLALVGLIAFIVIRALIGAQKQASLFHRIAASTLAIQFGVQSGINLAVNLDLIPPKGMTLPFVSYGGTSMIAVAFGMGLMLALTRKKPEERLATGLPAYRGQMVPAE